ncbi:MAG: MFS transporter [Rhodoferax sp.]|nr:MFS transporter [Rhodoferax sp.]
MPVSAAHPRRLVGWLSLAQLISWGSTYYLFGLLMAPIEQDLGLNRAQSSLAFSLALLTEGLAAYPVGRWIDRGHERSVMTGGSLLVALVLGLMSRAGNLAEFYLAWAGLGLGMAGVLYAPVFAVVTRRFPQDFRRAIITITFLGGLASTVFIPLDAALIDRLGWRQALLVLAALHLGLCAPLHAAWLRGAGSVRARPAAGLDDGSAPAPGGRPWTAHLRRPPFLLVGCFVVLTMGVTTALTPHLVSLLTEAGMAPGWSVTVPASVGLIQVAGRLLLYFFEHRVDTHRVNRWILGLLPLSLVALLVALALGRPPLGLLALFVLFWGLANGLLTIVKGTAVAQYVSRVHMASLMGVLGLPQALARAAAPLLLGLLWSPEAGYRSGVALLLAASLLAALAFVLAQRAAGDGR